MMERKKYISPETLALEIKVQERLLIASHTPSTDEIIVFDDDEETLDPEYAL